MWSSTNTASAARSLRLRAFAWFGILLALPCLAQTNELQVPGAAVAGSPATVSTSGSGAATFYLIGPSDSIKRQVTLGEEIKLSPEELRSAGRYLAILCPGACQSADFFVTAAAPETLRFLVHPSRVPADQKDAISGAAFVFDKFHNLVLAPVSVDFRLTSDSRDLMSRRLTTQQGVAWFRTSSGSKAGAVQVIASINGTPVRRVVQQVASDPCNLRITARSTAKGVFVETAPVRDCSGNPVPDGTIVTFTETGRSGVSTVDAPVKQGVARAEMIASAGAVVSAASGVVMGNELSLGARP
jgi:hypothetical protein